MLRPVATTRNRSEAGFSMVEMLLAALILAIGILGVSMMQIMALRVSQGSQGLSTAVQIAERVLDQVELEGRLTWLNQTNTNLAAPAALTKLAYLKADQAYPITESYNVEGQVVDAASADPRVSTPYYTITLNSVPVAGATVGSISDVTVAVDFVTSVGANNQTISRNVTLTRRILHA